MRGFGQGLALCACAHAEFSDTGAGGKGGPERGRSRSIPPHVIDVIFAPYDVIFRALRLTNEDRASLVRISPFTAVIFPPSKLSLKTRDEWFYTKNDTHRLDILQQTLPLRN